MSPKNCRVIVIGAGVVGLTTATLLQDALPAAEITIIAEKFLTETTSDGAAGLFRPGLSFSGPSKDVTIKWLKDSFRYYSNLIESRRGFKEAEEAGVVTRKVYCLSTKDKKLVRNFLIEEVVDDYRFLSPLEIKSIFNSSSYKYAATFTTVLTECRKYLPYLTKRFEARGGKIVKKRLESFEEISNDCDILFNCAGFGAKDLCNDTKMTPIRGQIYNVRAPWIENVVYMDTDTYIIPITGGTVVLGGTRQFDSTNEDVDVHDSAGIWERCTAVLPSLKDAQVQRQWVGLRPFRTEVRVEKELVTFKNGKSLKVIHNYGHGGYGVMASPGTSMEAVSLGIEALGEGVTSKL